MWILVLCPLCTFGVFLGEKVIFSIYIRYMAEEAVIVILVIFAFLGLVCLFLFLSYEQANGSPSPSSPGAPGAPGTPGAPGSSPAPFTQVRYTPPPEEDILSVIFTEIIPHLLEGVAFMAAISLALRPGTVIKIGDAFVDRLSALKSRLMGKAEFQNVIKPARDASFSSKTFTKRVAQLVKDGIITAADAARVGVKFGKNTLDDLAKSGKTWARNSDALTEELARNSTRLGATSAEVAGFRAAATTLQEVLGPFAAVYDAWSIVGMVLDMRGVGGWVKLAKTQDLLTLKAQNDPKQANEYFLRNSINYPFVVGPLDTMRMQLGDDVFNQLVDNEMVKLLCDGLASGSPDPVIQNILTLFYNQHYVNPNSSTIDIDLAFAIQQIDSTNYIRLYDDALSHMCTTNGGVEFDQGVPGWKKACTFSSKEQCYSNSVWTYQKGVYAPPSPAPSPSPSSSDSPYDGAYFEWRMPNYFSTVPINILNDPHTYHIQNVPTAGACIAQDPSFHKNCDIPVTVDGSQVLATGVAQAVNRYNRDTGVCYNDVPTMCDMYGVDQKGTDAGDAPTDPMGNKYPTCYISHDTQVAMDLVGQTIYQNAHSCTSHSTSAQGPCPPASVTYSDANGYYPSGVCRGNAFQPITGACNCVGASPPYPSQKCDPNNGEWYNP